MKDGVLTVHDVQTAFYIAGGVIVGFVLLVGLLTLWLDWRDDKKRR